MITSENRSLGTCVKRPSTKSGTEKSSSESGGNCVKDSQSIEFADSAFIHLAGYMAFGMTAVFIAAKWYRPGDSLLMKHMVLLMFAVAIKDFVEYRLRKVIC